MLRRRPSLTLPLTRAPRPACGERIGVRGVCWGAYLLFLCLSVAPSPACERPIRLPHRSLSTNSNSSSTPCRTIARGQSSSRSFARSSPCNAAPGRKNLPLRLYSVNYPSRSTPSPARSWPASRWSSMRRACLAGRANRSSTTRLAGYGPRPPWHSGWSLG